MYLLFIHLKLLSVDIALTVTQYAYRLIVTRKAVGPRDGLNDKSLSPSSRPSDVCCAYKQHLISNLIVQQLWCCNKMYLNFFLVLVEKLYVMVSE